MFDILGILAFLAMIYCCVMLVISIFSRKINTKVWGLVCGFCIIIFFTAYALDGKFEAKKGNIEIDYSDVVIETPSPSPEATPTPTPEATPTPIIIPSKEPTAEPTIQPTTTPTRKPARTPQSIPTEPPVESNPQITQPEEEQPPVRTAPTPTPVSAEE